MMASAVELVSPVQQIQYPAKRFLAPLPLSLFGELEDDSNGCLDDQSSSRPAKPTCTGNNITIASTSPPALINGDDEEEFGDFEDEFGDFESVPAGSAALQPTTMGQSSPTQQATPWDNGRPIEVTHDFLADFGAVVVSPVPAPTPAKSRPIVEEDLFGNFEAVTGEPRIEVSHANMPVYNFFGNYESPAIPQTSKHVAKNAIDGMVNLFADFSSLSVNGVDHIEPSSATPNATHAFEGFGSGALGTVEIEPTSFKNTSVNLLEAFGSDTFFDRPKRNPVNGFEDLFGDFKAPPSVNTHSSWGFASHSLKQGPGAEPNNNVVSGSDHSGFDPLGVFQLDIAETKSDSCEVIFFTPKAPVNAQENGGVSDDDWGDFVAPPPPVLLPFVQTTEVVSEDPFSVGSGDLFTNGNFSDFGNFGLPDSTSQRQQQTQGSGFIDSWETELMDSGTAKSNSEENESTVGAELETSSETSAQAPPVKVDASSFYQAQVSEFFPTSSSSKPEKDEDGSRSRSVDLDALYANPSPVVKTSTRAKSYVEQSAAPLSLSLFGEEDDIPPEVSPLNEFVGSGRHHNVDNGDEFPGDVSSSSDSQDDIDIDADEFFLANADDLHKLTLWLLGEGRVQEALACTNHTAALLVFQSLQEDYSRALESGDLEKASVMTTKIEAAHAKLAKPQEWDRWQKRQRHDNGFKHGVTPIVPKLTYEDMMSLLGGMSDPRGVYFRAQFQSDEIDSLAKKDLRAAAEHHTRALETFHLLISATVQEQLLYVKAWSALASSCASELELGMIFWQRAVHAQSQSHLLTHRKGRNYFAALGQVYSVFLVLGATVRLHAPWLEVAGEKGKAIHRLLDECRSCWNGSGLKDAVYWALSEANDSLPSTRTSWQGILDLSIAVNLASLKHSKAGTQPICGLSLLPVQTLPGIATVEWRGRQYFLSLANMWANCVEGEPPRLPILGLQQTV